MAEMSHADSPMPVLFVSHGSPLNVIDDNVWSRGFASLRELVPVPRAIVAISAHWYVPGTFVTASAEPQTIHDFYGFPRALFEIDYPAPGSPELAAQLVELIGQERAALRDDWGFDHGSWSVLRWMYPEAEIPVVQLSVDNRLGPRGHYEIGRSLAPLRDEGVLIMGSGNVTHNLRDGAERKRRGADETPDWALAFDRMTADALEQHDTERLLTLWPDEPSGRLSHPTPDHWFPLLYAYGAAAETDSVQFQMNGYDWGSLSMRNVVFG
jgi:4,5-DOPA dioxygenase extradiol